MIARVCFTIVRAAVGRAAPTGGATRDGFVTGLTCVFDGCPTRAPNRPAGAVWDLSAMPKTVPRPSFEWENTRHEGRKPRLMPPAPARSAGLQSGSDRDSFGG